MRKSSIILALIVAFLIPFPILALISLDWAMQYILALVISIIGIFAILFILVFMKAQHEGFEQREREIMNPQCSQSKPQFEVRVLTNKESAIQAQKEGFEVHEIRLSGDTWMCTYCQTINSSEKASCVNCGASRKEV